MKRCTRCLMMASGLFVAVAPLDLEAKESRAGHRFRGLVEFQYLTNDNIAIAPSSSERFDYATGDEFGEDEDEDETDADFEDEDIDDLVDVDPSEDEIAEDDGVDEDGDGIDDLIDPDANGLVESESRFNMKLGLSHQYLFDDRRTSWTNSVRFSSDRHSQRDALDKFNWALTTGLGFAPRGSRHAFRPSLSYVALDRDDRSFSTTLIASLGYTYRASRQLELSATYNYQDRDIANPSAPDARVDVLSLGAEWSASAKDIFKLKYAPKVEDSTRFTRDTDAWGMEFTYSRRLPWAMVAGVGYRFDAIEYTNLVPGRQDDNTTWGAQLRKEFDQRFSMEVGFESRERESNLAGKDASNESVFVGGAFRF